MSPTSDHQGHALIENVRIRSQDLLITPSQLKEKVPHTQLSKQCVYNSRQEIMNILDHKDNRLLVIVGPCSIHDVDAAKDYAQKLKSLSDKVNDTLYIAMRVYFEKPRTTVGWKGLINDPDMNDSFDIEKGLNIGRQLLIDLSEMGLPCATEALDPISPQYLQDLVSWSAIGARTAESQTHREMSSGLSCPVGFKNGTDGNLEVAINALLSVSKPHSFLGINTDGQVAITHTSGNPYAHIVLRGGGGKPNYDSVNIAIAEQQLAKAELPANIMVDCSHANSNKDAGLQTLVAENVVNQIIEGNRSICGLMIESNLEWGNQKLSADKSKMKYGVSVTDACIDWKTTEETLLKMRDRLSPVLTSRGNE